MDQLGILAEIPDCTCLDVWLLGPKWNLDHRSFFGIYRRGSIVHRLKESRMYDMKNHASEQNDAKIMVTADITFQNSATFPWKKWKYRNRYSSNFSPHFTAILYNPSLKKDWLDYQPLFGSGARTLPKPPLPNSSWGNLRSGALFFRSGKERLIQLLDYLSVVFPPRKK